MSPSGSNGLLFLPYMSGERTPIFDPKARGIYAGLALSHNRGDLYRSILEGTAYAIRMNFEAMLDAGATIDHAVAVGGGASNQIWLQMVSDVSGISQFVPEKIIGASYGDAFLAGFATGVIKEIQVLKKDWVAINQVIQPQVKNKPTYDKFYGLFKDLYSKSKEVLHELADWQVAE